MASLVLFLILPILFNPTIARSNSNEEGFISVVISETGLVFIKDVLIHQAVRTLVPIRIPDIQKSIRIPFIGRVHVSISNITISYVNVSSSIIRPEESGVAILASGANASLSMDWRYSYSTWLVPIEISDEGTASIQVGGMKVGLTISMDNRNGTLALSVADCGCYVEDIFISLDGGASWFYQGLLNAFGDQIRSSVEDTITKKIIEGTSKLDSLLQTLPKKIDVDKVVSLNVTFVNDPSFGNSSVEFDINGLFIPSDKVASSNHIPNKLQPSVLCGHSSRMLGISLEEAVFNSLLAVYFQEGLMQQIVNKVPDQSLLNTGSWKYLVPQLYKKYPNDEMQLNISLVSPPVITITPQNIGSTIFSDMTINVLDASETVSVACISMVVSVSGIVEISGNSLVGKAGLNNFTLKLKWSKVGNFRMHLIQGVMRAFLNTVFMPYVNSRLRKGFPLPVIRGFTLQNTEILSSSSRVVLCSDVAFWNYDGSLRFLF